MLKALIGLTAAAVVVQKQANSRVEYVRDVIETDALWNVQDEHPNIPSLDLINIGPLQNHFEDFNVRAPNPPQTVMKEIFKKTLENPCAPKTTDEVGSLQNNDEANLLDAVTRLTSVQNCQHNDQGIDTSVRTCRPSLLFSFEHDVIDQWKQLVKDARKIASEPTEQCKPSKISKTYTNYINSALKPYSSWKMKDCEKAVVAGIGTVITLTAAEKLAKKMKEMRDKRKKK